ncbi:hypothetical protein FHT91_000045 [Rhizobium sp. BK347]|uniref:Uncharacterized protein n=1 Tax=Rhizobium tropici TaxID=398 RepID=A0A329YAH2_RHITR|nr:hypothetical protein [Rhizobium sp. BK252]MBB3399827.1 hypothetical protein [Rhizobium sp. BK289]MBB3412407.1 hypothetical protein [Rhizobium sp. BK284]MBB3480293.1 hypothetical protein [Rhizobium sp. BK347]RAX38005.1 hypothetical protein DQ393_25565 [Rhizobium tropici]
MDQDGSQGRSEWRQSRYWSRVMPNDLGDRNLSPSGEAGNGDNLVMIEDQRFCATGSQAAKDRLGDFRCRQ